MANVAGVDTALLSSILLDVESAWSTNQASIETNDVQAKTFEALVSKQLPLEAALIAKVKDSDKDYDVKVYWPDFCGKTAQDCVTDTCGDLTATMAEVKEKAYKITSCIEDGFAIEENKLKDSVIDPAVLIKQSMNAAIKRLLEKANAKGIAFLNGNMGYNAGGGAVGYSFTGGLTEVPGADYTMDLMPKIMYDMILNKVPAGFVVDGGKLWLPYTNAKLNAGNGQGKGDAARSELFDATFDMHGFAGASLTDRTFVVAPYSYAFLTKNYVKNRVPELDEAMGTRGMWKYSMPIAKYGLVLDVYMQRVCVDGNKQRFTTKWLMKLHYDYKLNPTGCDLGGGNIVTGIWGYKKTA